VSVGFGWLPDEPDDRDLAFAMPVGQSATDPPPFEATAEHLFTPNALDQNGHNSCVVQSLVQGIYASHVRDGHDSPPLASRHHIWYPCRRLMRKHKLNAGTQNRTAFKVVNKLGFCQEKYWPHDLSMADDAPMRKQPSTLVQQMAHDQREKAGQVIYRRIYELGRDRIDRLKRCIAAGFTPQFGTAVSKQLANNQIDPHVPIGPPGTGEVAGLHAMIAGAYHDNDFKVRTSWGRNHCDNGWFWMNADCVAEWSDIWYIEHAPWYSELSA
jgi:hypothetical protein